MISTFEGRAGRTVASRSKVRLSTVIGVSLPAVEDRREEAVEQELGVVRPGRSLRVVLDREQGLRGVLEAFDGAVVEVQLRHLNGRVKVVAVDGVAVILRRDVNASGRFVTHRVVRPAMPELQLVGA